MLDNCERVADACREIVERLLEAGAPSLRMITTTQRALQARDETIVRVPPLALPPALTAGPAGSAHHNLSYISGNPAVQLFVRRASAVAPSFSLSAENAVAVGEICRAARWAAARDRAAAARVRVLSAQQIFERLEDRFRLLNSGHKTDPSRHETLSATLGWSVSLLNAEERDLLVRLAVFSGGWTLDAAADVAAAAGGGAPVLDLLEGLVDKSLVIADTDSTEARYRMLETVRSGNGAELA